MSTDRIACASARSPFVCTLAALFVLAAAAAGCGNDVQTCEDCGTGGAGECTTGKGTLEGTLYRWAPPGEPGSELAPGASVVLLAGPDGTPLYGEADQDGKFSIPLDAGTWTVRGDDGGGCETSQAQTVTLDACETEQVVVVLDICAG